jgi:hypothetical protein
MPEPQPRDHGEMVVIGHQDRACFQAVRYDPDIIDRNRFSGFSERGHDEPENIRRFNRRFKLTLFSLIDILWSAEEEESSGHEMPEVPSGKS